MQCQALCQQNILQQKRQLNQASYTSSCIRVTRKQHDVSSSRSPLLHSTEFIGNSGAISHRCTRLSKQSAQSRSSISCNGVSQTIKEPQTGVEFAGVQSLWAGEKYRCLGVGVRSKKIAFIGLKVYAVALYVEAEKAAKELGVRSRGGFFVDAPSDDYCLAITDGAFDKALQVHLVRDVDGETFFGALEEALEPRLRLMGELTTLNKFKTFFEGKKLEKNTELILLWRSAGALDVLLLPTPVADLSKAIPDLTIESSSLCRALFEVYLGGNSVVPDAKKSWAEGTIRLLESEEVKRRTRKSGS